MESAPSHGTSHDRFWWTVWLQNWHFSASEEGLKRPSGSQKTQERNFSRKSSLPASVYNEWPLGRCPGIRLLHGKLAWYQRPETWIATRPWCRTVDTLPARFLNDRRFAQAPGGDRTRHANGHTHILIFSSFLSFFLHISHSFYSERNHEFKIAERNRQFKIANPWQVWIVTIPNSATPEPTKFSVHLLDLLVGWLRYWFHVLQHWIVMRITCASAAIHNSSREELLVDGPLVGCGVMSVVLELDHEKYGTGPHVPFTRTGNANALKILMPEKKVVTISQALKAALGTTSVQTWQCTAMREAWSHRKLCTWSRVCSWLPKHRQGYETPLHSSLAAGGLDMVPSGKHAHMIITY